MLNQSAFVKAGILGKPHGVSGETTVRLLPGMESYQLFPTYVYILISGGLVPYRVEACRYKSDEVLLVKLPLLDTQEKIRALLNCDVFLAPEEMEQTVPSSDGINPLIGYGVTDVNLGFVGTISDIQEITGNPLFVVTGKMGEVLIPATDDFVVAIDDEAKLIRVDTPEGLLEINEEP